MGTATFGGFILAIALALLVVPIASAESCAVASNYGWLMDTDCDGMPDEFDNSPENVNSQDSVGELIANSDGHVRQGEFADIMVRVINNRDGPISNIFINVEQDELGIDVLKSIPYVPSGEATELEFSLEIPPCAEVKDYVLSISSEFNEPTNELASEVQERKIFVEEGGVCGVLSGPLEQTIINVFGRVDVDKEEDVIIPITIMNEGSDEATYHASLDDLNGWGAWRIDPAPSIVIPGGHEGTLFLTVQTEKFTPPGTRSMELSVSSNGQKTTVPLDVYVRAPIERAMSLGTFLVEAIFIILLMIVIGIIGVLVLMHLNRRHRKDDTPVIYEVKKTKKSTKKSAKKRKKVAVEKVKKSNVETYY